MQESFNVTGDGRVVGLLGKRTGWKASGCATHSALSTRGTLVISETSEYGCRVWGRVSS